MLTRRKPMNRGKGFKRPELPTVLRRGRRDDHAGDALPQLAPQPPMLLLRRGTYAAPPPAPPVDKERASQSQAYQVATRSLGYCMRCGCRLAPGTGAAQFCHADAGKGQGIKTDVRRGWNGCASCHRWVGTDRKGLTKAARRALEQYLAWKNRCALRRRGLWPASLPDTWAERDATEIPHNPEERSTPP